MNRRSLIQKLFGALAVFPFVSKLMARHSSPEAPRWKHLAFSSEDVNIYGPGREEEIRAVLDSLTKGLNQVVKKCRGQNEPVAHIEIAWRNILDRETNPIGEKGFFRAYVVYGHPSLGNLDERPSGFIRVQPVEKLNANG